ncbi:MAG: protein kinase [Chromatiaceae bacterium]|nr:protein kinase [Chromatiaceae bacterium]
MTSEQTRVQPLPDLMKSQGNPGETQSGADWPPATSTLNPDAIGPGSLLANTYRVERLLGGGGMGEVYLARHAGLGTEHAIKVIRPAMATDQQVMDLFYREAKVLRGVRHDAVVNYDGFIRDDRGRDYLVMEYAEGLSLSQLIERGPLAPAQVLALRDKLASGLAEAHRKGAVHRDISPDNIILMGGQVDAPKLIDFGLCKLTDPTQQSIIGSSFAGKFRYASPEQFGLFGGEIDARSDIYSLGLVLAAAARGRPLDMGNSFESAINNRRKTPDLSEVPTDLRDWLKAMLEPDPARRPESAQAIIEHWPARPARSSDSNKRGSGRASDRDSPDRKGRTHPLVWLALLLVLGSVGGGLYWLLRPLPQVQPLTTPPRSAQPDQPSDTSATGSEVPEGTAQASNNADGSDGELSRLLRSRRLDDAFTLAQERLAAGNAPPQQALWALAESLQEAGQLDRAFAVARELANKGDGPAAFLVAEFYDPLYWTEADSPLSKPNPRKALEWYQQAAARGVGEAQTRYDALATRQSQQEPQPSPLQN